MTINNRPLFDAWIYIMLSFLIFFQPWIILYYMVNGTFYNPNPIVNLAWSLPLLTVFLGFVYVTGAIFPGFFVSEEST